LDCLLVFRQALASNTLSGRKMDLLQLQLGPL